MWGGCPPGRVGLIWEMPLTLVPHLPRSHVDHFCPVSIYFSVLEDSFFEHLHSSHVNQGPGRCFFFVLFQSAFLFLVRIFFQYKRMTPQPILILRSFMCNVAEWVGKWMASSCYFFFTRNNSKMNSHQLNLETDFDFPLSIHFFRIKSGWSLTDHYSSHFHPQPIGIGWVETTMWYLAAGLFAGLWPIAESSLLVHNLIHWNVNQFNSI